MARKRASRARRARKRRQLASLQPRVRPSPSPDLQEASKIALLERFDTHARLRNGLRRFAAEENQWAGVPMPLDDLPMTIEPNFPRAEALSLIGRKPTPQPSEDDPAVNLRNVFFSRKWRCDIYVYDEGGKAKIGKIPKSHHVDLQLSTIRASDAWGVEQEGHAVNTLAQLISHRQFKQYMLTGSFLASSPRSNLFYIFRRLRPTIVLSTRTGHTKILCCLCMHPIGYYEDSWGGAMCPTDDVIAHLMLMRADEPMLWRRSNQHSPWRPEAGI